VKDGNRISQIIAVSPSSEIDNKSEIAGPLRSPRMAGRQQKTDQQQ
jgi:hypothetical protein